MVKLLNVRLGIPNMQRRVGGIVNKSVFAHKKHRAFRVTKGGVKAFYQSVGRPFGIDNFPKQQRRLRMVSARIGGKGVKRLLAGRRQEGLFVLHGADTKVSVVVEGEKTAMSIFRMLTNQVIEH